MPKLPIFYALFAFAWLPSSTFSAVPETRNWTAEYQLERFNALAQQNAATPRLQLESCGTGTPRFACEFTSSNKALSGVVVSDRPTRKLTSFSLILDNRHGKRDALAALDAWLTAAKLMAPDLSDSRRGELVSALIVALERGQPSASVTMGETRFTMMFSEVLGTWFVARPLD